MDIDSLRQSIEQAGYASAGIGLLAGLAFSINPVAIAAIPVSLAYVTRAREKRTALLFGGMFITGLIVTHIALGVIAGYGGRWVINLLGRYWGVVLGPLLIFLGLIWAGWVRVPLPAASFRGKSATGPWGAFILGIPFAVAVCPVCTPVLIVMLGIVAGIGSPLLGAILLLGFAIGRSIPIALGAWAVQLLDKFLIFSKYQHALDVAGGLLLVGSGLYLLNTVFFLVPALAA